ncbi:helix-turn-helix transcriptional regulator [Kribbella shirazensis]|uniref:DNA-binding CsgD family transcriptional regulator n=1 Tax=Kribbella shirazensis TaxID=1105143 RepID=A0A7X5V8G9_9ACTN|nr:AAA family ATPase [Kribbella shirazensis]NIK56576.1 DNA-binding CsgD family transcriptional regulator [Kribbella shirazensis]
MGSAGDILAPRFVGRDREAATLREALARSEPVVLLIEGEAGIGKTRLVQEVLRSDPRTRLLVSCPPYSQPFTLAAVVDALRAAVDDVRRLSLSPLTGALRPVFPEWTGHLPPSPEPLDDSAAARHRLFRALAELIDAVGVSLLVVEDAQWADPATIDLLLYLQTRPVAKLSLLITCRTPDLARLRLVPGTIRIRLDGLTVGETATLVSSMLAEPPVSEAFAGFLRAGTDGVPLALEETVRLMHARADLTRRDGAWVRRHLDQIMVPARIRDGVLERLAHLDGPARAVVRAAAVVGEPVTVDGLVAITGLARELAYDGVTSALGVQLLEERGAGVAFRHALVRQAVYGEIPAHERRVAHRTAGELLEASDPDRFAQLAEHFRAARDLPRWRRYAEQAADAALAAGDETTAVGYLFDLAVGAGLNGAELARISAKITYSAVVGEDRYEALIGCLRRALDACGSEPSEVRGALRFQLARALGNSGDFAQSRRELELAVPDLAHDRTTSMRAMLMLGLPHGMRWPVARHLGWLRRARSLADLDDPAEGTRFLVDHTVGLLGLGEPSGWRQLRLVPDAVTDPRQRDDLARGNINLSDAAMLWGRHRVARRMLDRAAALAEGRGYVRIMDLIRLNRLRLDWHIGAWDGLADRAAELAGNQDIPANTRVEALLVALWLDHAAGRELTRLDEAVRGVWQFAPTSLTAEVAALSALAPLTAGSPDEAVRITDPALEVIRTKQLWLWATELVPVRVAALVAAGRHDEASELTAAFARGIPARHARSSEAAVATCAAFVAEGNGDLERAGTAFLDAARAWNRLPRPYAGLLMRERAARCALAAGRTEAALAQLADVFDRLAAMDARFDATRVLHVLTEYGVKRSRPWWGGRKGYGDQLSPRELEVVRLVAEGRSNREVAEALFRSPHTVSSQLSSALRKLGLSSRHEIPAAAREAGLL